MRALLALEDGRIFEGESFGAQGTRVGEVCFNTSMTGYQEVLTDPSYRGQIVAMIAGANEPLLVSVELFDVFSGEQAQNFGAGKKSMAYALTYRDKTRTLTSEEITVVHAKIRERLQRELGVELRE